MSLSNFAELCPCKFMTIDLKWVLSTAQKSSVFPGTFIFPSFLVYLFSHSAKCPYHTSSHSSNTRHHLCFLFTLRCASHTWCRRSGLVTWNSNMAPAHLLFCLHLCPHALSFACGFVRSVSCCQRPPWPLVPWIPFAQPSEESCSLYLSWKISPFTYVCTSFLSDWIISTEMYPNIPPS